MILKTDLPQMDKSPWMFLTVMLLKKKKKKAEVEYEQSEAHVSFFHD